MAGEYGGALNLPPGFRFSPTDEELILHFLLPKARHMRCYPDIIPDLGYSMPHPWQLHGKALRSENRYYFFRRVLMKDDETEINSSKSTGIWKEVLEEEEEEDDHKAILSSSGGEMHVIGLKKLLVYFCSTEPDHDHQTNWFMQQYYLHHQYNLDYCTWTLCTVEERKGRLDQSLSYDDEEDNGSQLSYLDEMYLEFDDYDDSDVTFPT